MEATKIKMWTWGYFPFILGGDVYRPICAEVEALGPFDLGKGYEGYFVVDPKTGRTYVVEKITGGIVGNFIEEVMKDVAEGDDLLMAKQIKEYEGKLARAESLTAEDLFRRLAK